MAIVDQGQAGTTLTQTVSAIPHWENVYSWTINKSAAPEVLNLFRNDTGSVQYTVTVMNDTGTIQVYIEGQVCITNGGAQDTSGLLSTLILETPVGTEILQQALDVSANPVLLAGQTFCYPYRINVPAGSIQPGQSFKVTADTTILNHSGHIGTPFGPATSASGNFPAQVTNINQSINVNDTNGVSAAFSALLPPAPQTLIYSRDYSCNAGQGYHTNTATIAETGQSASAVILVNCYDLIVTKTVQPAFTRLYKWTITKKAVDSGGVEVTSLTLGLNESFTVQYVIEVIPTFTDIDFKVTGTITVQNPNPEKTAVVVLSDIIQPGSISSTVTPATISVPPGTSVTASYSASLPDSASRSDQATAVLNNTPSGTTAFSSLNVPFDFSSAIITQVDACVNVMDSFAGMLNSAPVCSTQQFTYNRTFGPYASCTGGSLQFPNTATFTTTDTQFSGTATWSISVSVPCSGCTLTIGYWKTHAGFGPQPDVVTPLLPVLLGTSGGAKTVTVATASQAVSILNFGGSNGVIDASNGINRLYVQLLAALLNGKSGADTSAVASAISAANAFLATHNSLDWAGLNRTNRNFVNNLQSTLDQYNNGIIGPGHCSEQSSAFAAPVLLAAAATEADTDADPDAAAICTPPWCVGQSESVPEQAYQEDTSQAAAEPTVVMKRVGYCCPYQQYNYNYYYNKHCGCDYSPCHDRQQWYR